MERMRDSGRKAVAITAGEAHTVGLTGDGSVYSWGRGTFGRLGNGSETDQPFPLKIEFHLPIVSISAGAYHTLALADDGSVWSWGYNASLPLIPEVDICGVNDTFCIFDNKIDGQLGFDGDNSLVPCMVKLPITDDESLTNNQKKAKICSVKAGGMMSAAIDDGGSLWMWGNCSLSSWKLDGHNVVKVACGSEHVVALVNAAGEIHGDFACYSWGNNNHGQLGVGDTDTRQNPQIVEKFNTESPYEVACGAFHTCILANRNTGSSVCWSFGRGDNGQLGHGTTKNSLYPQLVTGLPEKTVLISVDCGLFHNSVVSSSGNVWSWGMESGLGLCPEATFTESVGGDALTPRLVGQVFPEPVQVTCGAAHTVLLADSGYKLWSWGRGASGILGNGQNVDSFTPKAVLWALPDQQEPQTVDNKPTVQEEMDILQLKLSVMERYAGILHGCIFGKPFEGDKDIPLSVRNTGTFDIAKEWEKMLESCDRGKLVHLQMFYRNILAGVEDKMMKLRIKEMMKEYLESAAASSSQ